MVVNRVVPVVWVELVPVAARSWSVLCSCHVLTQVYSACRPNRHEHVSVAAPFVARLPLALPLLYGVLVEDHTYVPARRRAPPPLSRNATATASPSPPQVAVEAEHPRA
jgi:hypothetical protein